MKRPWHKYSVTKPWMEEKPSFGVTRLDVKEYHTTRWRALRKVQLTSHPLCAMCEAKGIITAAVMVDHVRSIANGGDFWDMSNLQSLCSHCHRVKTNKEISKRKN